MHGRAEGGGFGLNSGVSVIIEPDAQAIRGGSIMGMLEFLRRCKKCDHTEIIEDGTDHGPILVQGRYRCNETDWQIIVTLRTTTPEIRHP